MFRIIKDSYSYELIFYFLIYSFMGWFLETSIIFIQSGNIVERGFIFGPFCIIYGFGMLTLIILLKPLKDKTFLYFLYSTIIITLLEYSTGFVLEIIFNRRWWDYSHLPLNLNGHITFTNSIIWGLLATIISRYLQPILEILMRKIANSKLIYFSPAIPLFFITNILISILYYL